MDFDYPDFDEDFSPTPKPVKATPDLLKPYDPLGLTNSVADLPKPTAPVAGSLGQPGIPSVDRSTKPKPSPANSNVNPPRNASMNSLTEAKSVSIESKNNLVAEAQRKEQERRNEEVERRRKEEELQAQTEKDKEAEEQEAKRMKLQREIQVIHYVHVQDRYDSGRSR